MTAHDHDEGRAADRIADRDRTRSEREAERAATLGGFTGAVLGARGGPVGAGIGAFLGGSTGYAVGYALSELDGDRGEPRETTLDDFGAGHEGGDGPRDDPQSVVESDGPVRIEVGEESAVESEEGAGESHDADEPSHE